MPRFWIVFVGDWCYAIGDMRIRPVLLLLLLWGGCHGAPERQVGSTLCIDIAGECHPLIAKGSKLPASYSETFSNQVQDQKTILISLFEGEGKRSEQNTALGKFQLPLTPAPVGQARLAVTVRIDLSGAITLLTHDLTSGNKSELTVR